MIHPIFYWIPVLAILYLLARVFLWTTEKHTEYMKKKEVDDMSEREKDEVISNMFGVFDDK